MVTSFRKIILFIDNSTAHGDIPPLKAIKVQFLPPNTTSQLQDQGIIKNFKTLYRKEVVRKMIADMEQNTSSINVLQAMRMVDKAWRNVTPLAVKNCFRTCGFSSEPQEIIEEEDNNVPEEWNKHMSGSNITFEDFVTCDDEVVTAGTLTEKEILESVNNCIESDKDDDFNDEPQTSSTSVSINEAKTALTTVRSFIEQCNNIKDNVFSSLFII